MKCPNCGGSIILDNEKEFLFCPYCGTAIPQEKSPLDKILDFGRFSKEHKEKVRQRKVSEESKGERSVFILLGVICAVFALVMILAVGRPHYARVQELEKIVQEIETDILAGEYDAAELKANRLRLDDGYSDEQNQKWDKERECLLKLIQEKRPR